ncbi:unnamed protein product [Cylindrotheca closterium]|uniref:STI1 domain-containing protein n=1 Tax=Cylindrotheca closterium TaxID=2856 RepID=A0AAD2JHU3_9STRA|nr:unnamed protein product [Cylindrotheca closterium]
MKLFFVSILFAASSAFQTQSFGSHVPILSSRQQASAMYMSSAPIDDEDDEEIEPGKMRVSEIKAELDLRVVDYSDCFDKDSLAKKLEEARATGKASPDVLDKFNKQRLEDNFNENKLEIKDEELEQAIANDGTLPGGMNPDMFKELMSNPDVMALLQNSKMQEAMKIMMTEGQDGIEKAIAEDPELLEIVKELNALMQP